jgi:hypothetical protein
MSPGISSAGDVGLCRTLHAALQKNGFGVVASVPGLVCCEPASSRSDKVIATLAARVLCERDHSRHGAGYNGLLRIKAHGIAI